MIYKNKYLIAVYDSDDNLKTCVDNVHEFATHFNIEKRVADSILSRSFHGKQKTFLFKDDKLTIHFILESEMEL